MTRKSLALFVISFFVSLTLLSLFIGEQGFFYTRAMKKHVDELEYKKAALQAQVDSLEEQSKRLSEGEGLKDAAFKLGYQSEGEQVFYFADDSPSRAVQPEAEERAPSSDFSYFYLPLWALALLALFISFGIVLLYAKRMGRRERKHG
ncbi:MAG: septum formation initiator family protein [Sphaerochaetaceae bacterium]